jgi:hypothetical protein
MMYDDPLVKPTEIYCPDVIETHPRLEGKNLPPIHVVLASNQKDFVIK